MKLAVLSLLLAGASAFTVPQNTRAFTRVAMSEEAAEAPVEVVAEPEPASPSYTCISKEAILASPNTVEIGQVWDPLGLAKLGSDETLAWFRHSEVKHGRIAMAAFVGWWAVGAGLRFPGELAHGLDFSSLPSKGLEAWDAVPGWGKAQMLLFAGLIEFHDELFHSRRGQHYMRGGTPGKVSQIFSFVSHISSRHILSLIFYLLCNVYNVCVEHGSRSFRPIWFEQE